MTRALVPEAAGGFGVTVTDALSLLRVAGAHAVPAPLAETMLAGWLLAGAGLAVPDGPLSVGPVRQDETIDLRRVGDAWQVAGTLTRVPWGRTVTALALSAQHEGQPWVALVGKDAWSVEAGENVAREPRDTMRLDSVALAAAQPG